MRSPMPMTASSTRNRRRSLLLAAGLALGSALALTPAGCNIVGGLVGGMAESYKRSSTKTVEAEHTGLEGKSFAVVVTADRMIQADHPEVVAKLTIDIADQLAREAGASGYVPGMSVLQYQYNNPRWVTMPLGELAKALDVQRLVFVDLQEYRLNDPGNPYIWQGVAAALVGVVHADAALPDEFLFQKQLRVKYPDKGGMGPSDLPRAAVNTTLVKRLVDRASWLMYAHEEPYYPDY